MAEGLRAWCVYVLRDPRDESIRYVGVTTSVRKRYDAHLRAKDATPRATWIRELLSVNLKPGIEIVQEGDGDYEAAEKRWIAQYRAAGCRLTNTTSGGNGTAGYEWTAEARAKVGATSKGRKHSPESVAQKAANHRAIGRKLSEENKAIVSRTHKGVSFMTDEGRKRVSESSRNRQVSEETRAKISKNMAGRIISPEWRAKIAAGVRGLKHSEEARAKMREAWQKRKSERSSFPEMGIGRGRRRSETA